MMSIQLSHLVQAEMDAQCHPSKHATSGSQSGMTKQGAGGALMGSPFYPVSREAGERGMRHAVSKDGVSAQLLALQSAQRTQKVGAAPRTNSFCQANSWEWANAPHGRQPIASSADLPSNINDPSGLVMEMQTAFEESSGMARVQFD